MGTRHRPAAAAAAVPRAPALHGRQPGHGTSTIERLVHIEPLVLCEP